MKTPTSTPPSPDAQRFRRTLIKVMTMQAISLLGLWLLQVVYGA